MLAATAAMAAGEVEIERFLSRPAFVSCFGKDSTHSWLPIPSRFIQLYADQVSRECRIRGPDGAAWNVEVGGPGLESIGMRRGWKAFAVAYGIQAGDVVVVRLVEHSVFQAEIFGRSRVNKIPRKSIAEEQVKIEERRREENEEEEMKGEIVDNSSEEERRKGVTKDEEEQKEEEKGGRRRGRWTTRRNEEEKRREIVAKEVKEKKDSKNEARVEGTVAKDVKEVAEAGRSVRRRGPGRRTSAASPPTPAAPPVRSLDLAISSKRKKSDEDQEKRSRRRPVTDAERKRALELAEKFTSSNPFSVSVMARSHVYRGFWMGVKQKFARESLPSEICEMVLLDANGDRWDARYLANRHGISGGWRKFALDHSLEEGDVVIFERIDRTKVCPVLRVHIFRVVELDEQQLDVEAAARTKKAKTETFNHQPLKIEY